MSMDKLTLSNFFHFYIFTPNSKKLSPKDKRIAILGNVLMGMTLGIGHGICGLIYLYDKKMGKTTSETSKKIETTTKPILNPKIETTTNPILNRREEPLKEIRPQPDPTLVEPTFTPKKNILPININETIASLAPEHLLCKTANLFSPKNNKEQRIEAFHELTYSKYCEGYAGNISTDEKVALQQNVQERISQYDEAFQFSERLDPKLSKLILMADFECAIADSAIPFALMSKEELLSLDNHFIKELNLRQLKMIKERTSAMPVPVSKPNHILNETFSLADFRSTENINAYLNKLDIAFMTLLSDAQIQNLDFSNVSKEQFAEIIPTRYVPMMSEQDLFERKINLLSPEQMNSNPSLFSGNELKYLQKEKLQKLNLPLFKAQFPRLFPLENGSRHEEKAAASRINDLSKEQVDDCLHLFDLRQLKYLTVTQVKNLNYSYFTTVSKETENVFYNLFCDTWCDSNNVFNQCKDRFQILDVQQLYILFPYFISEKGVNKLIYNLMSSDQLKQLNFAEQPLDQAQFDALFPNDDYGNLPNWRDKNSLVPHLTNEQIIVLLPLFTPIQTSFLTNKQLQEINFERNDKQQIVNKMFAIPTQKKNQFELEKMMLEQFKNLTSTQMDIVKPLLSKDLQRFYPV